MRLTSSHSGMLSALLRAASVPLVGLASGVALCHEVQHKATGLRGSEAVIVGCGSSSAVPRLRCLVSPDGPCAVCADAAANPHSRNHRGNPSLLIRHVGADGAARCASHVASARAAPARGRRMRFVHEAGPVVVARGCIRRR